MTVSSLITALEEYEQDGKGEYEIGLDLGEDRREVIFSNPILVESGPDQEGYYTLWIRSYE